MKTLPLFIFILFTSSVFSQVETKKLSIYFDSLTTNEGYILILVEDQNEKEVSKLVIPIHNLYSQADIYLPIGSYGITAFHDFNGNDKLDTNILGIPTEPYGFSNNVRNLLSKPKIEKRLIHLNESKSITFKIEGYP